MNSKGNSPLEELTDLIEEARSGNAVARSMLMRASRAALKDQAERELPADVRMRIDPSDVIQEVLLEAHRDFATFQGNDRFAWQAWLHRVLANNVVECIRKHVHAEKRSVRREHPMDSEDAFFGTNDSSPSQRAMQSELANWLRNMQSQLSPEHQTILKMRYWEGAALHEIAVAMNFSKSKVTRLLGQVLQEFRQQITENTRSDDFLEFS